MNNDLNNDLNNVADRMLWLSYIIPLYNNKPYVSMCLDSILMQGLEEEEYEVIVVNDGSTDKGETIVEDYCLAHANFHLKNKENGGVSSARNLGIKEARGTYLYFMDADDRLLPNGMRVLYDTYLKGCNNPDMLTFCSHTVDKHYNPRKWDYIGPHKELFCGSFLEYGNIYGFGWSVCTRIFSRYFIWKNDIRFLPYCISEDVIFMMQVFTITDAKIVATDLNIYRYCVRENSAITSLNKKYIKQVFYDFITLYKQVERMKFVSMYKVDIFEHEIHKFQRMAFTRLLSCPFTYSDIKAMSTKALQENFYPIKNANTLVQSFINWLIRYPVVIYLFAIPFRCIFIPYIEPWINRN